MSRGLGDVYKRQSYNRVIIDAKSFLGVLSLDLNRELTVKYGGHDMNFENVLSKYATA